MGMAQGFFAFCSGVSRAAKLPPRKITETTRVHDSGSSARSRASLGADALPQKKTARTQAGLFHDVAILHCSLSRAGRALAYLPSLAI
jgi:hypothetical protein